MIILTIRKQYLKHKSHISNCVRWSTTDTLLITYSETKQIVQIIILWDVMSFSFCRQAPTFWRNLYTKLQGTTFQTKDIFNFEHHESLKSHKSLKIY